MFPRRKLPKPSNFSSASPSCKINPAGRDTGGHGHVLDCVASGAVRRCGCSGRRVLRPGGLLVMSDWLRGGEGAYSPEMLEYVPLEGITYNMASFEQSRAALGAAGFVDVETRDRSDWYRALAARKCACLGVEWFPTLVEFLGKERASHFVVDWQQLVIMLERGELKPAHIRARKPQ